MNDYKQLMKYEGEITFDKIEEILILFNQRMPETQCPKCKIRMFSIMVEVLENAYRHNFNTPEQNPQIKLSLIQNELHYALTVGNRVGNNELKQLTNRIDKLNSLSIDEVKALYSKTIHEGHISEKGGAGLGLMKILRCSREPIKYTVEPIDSVSSNIDFTISITDQPKQ
ncbi:MAG: SiaB family protein kinase [Salinivirgaceae bacterium]|nr:SiaB family protein kinase [Salinivirgaceae bacterium]MBO7478786.1 SiaB family protein kinase [Salinivirgaceae bacterium]